MARTLLRVGFLGFGEVGQRLAQDLRARGFSELSAFDLKFADQSSLPFQAATHLGVNARTSAHEFDPVDVLISAVTAASAVSAAEQAASGRLSGTFYLDLNSASPGAKSRAAARVAESGGRYVEAAVMSPIHPKGIGTAMLLGGPDAAGFMEYAEPLGLVGAVPFAQELGKASAVKMCRSVLVKGLEALLTESLVAARYYDVVDVVLASLTDLLPLSDWPGLSRYMISRSIEHGVRRAEEMRESAATVAEGGIAPIVTAAVADRQQATAAALDALSQPDLQSFLASLARHMEK